MSSCRNQSSTVTMFLLAHKTKTPPFLRTLHRFRNSRKYRSIVYPIAPVLTVSSSVSSVISAGNAIAAAGSGSSLHGAVTSAITHVAVTAVAIASGACLSTKVDFLWPKVEEQAGSLILEGVDVTGYPIFSDAKVQKAIAFAKKAHCGQLRKTGDPYLTHCIHTGRILAILVPSSGKRAVDTVVAGILHDVIDDTCESLHKIEEDFGDDVAKLVAGVSRLSYINQLLRRHRRIHVNSGTLDPEEANNLRVMLLGMVDDPRVVLIKLADRLHNMRTIYVLPLPKAQAVAEETLVIWCSLASRLGLWALKAELEDLCFAVLQPQIFRKMRADLASMWSPISRAGNLRRISARASLLPLDEKSLTSDYEGAMAIDEDITSMKIVNPSTKFRIMPVSPVQTEGSSFFLSLLQFITTSNKRDSRSKKTVSEIMHTLRDDDRSLFGLVDFPLTVRMVTRAKHVGEDLLEAVAPFDIWLDRRRRTKFLNSLGTTLETHTKPKVLRDAGIALASLVICEEALERELIISTSYVPGMEVTLYSRLKSVYSIHSKMKRKDVSISKVYDARALRVVVGDKNGTLHGPAVQCCYNLLDIVHKLWTPIDGEFDDYIINPKPSGYQSLHTAVQGPDSSPLEVQIRTQRMHEYAEHGLAAHWLYKETGNKFSSTSSMDASEIDASEIEASPYFSKDMEDQSSNVDDLFQKYSSLKVGHPVLRVEGSHLLAAVIIRMDNGGRELLVAVSFGLAASEAVVDRRCSFQIKRWEAYARLFKKVSDEWWCEPGHGDWCTCLEKYALSRDGMYHKQDQFGRLLPTFIQVIDLTEQEEYEYWTVVSAVFDGRQIDSLISRSSFESLNSNSMEASINNKVRLLRTMLQWEACLGQAKHDEKSYRSPGSVVLGEVVIVCWPHGQIMRLRTGSTAADAARRVGLEGKLVLINGHLALPSTELKDGDVVEVRL